MRRLRLTRVRVAALLHLALDFRFGYGPLAINAPPMHPKPDALTGDRPHRPEVTPVSDGPDHHEKAVYGRVSDEVLPEPASGLQALNCGFAGVIHGLLHSRRCECRSRSYRWRAGGAMRELTAHAGARRHTRGRGKLRYFVAVHGRPSVIRPVSVTYEMSQSRATGPGVPQTSSRHSEHASKDVLRCRGMSRTVRLPR